MPGVVSPEELLQKLQLIQQEQSLASHDPPRLCPGLAPRFLGPTQATAGQKAALQFQVSTVMSVSSCLTCLVFVEQPLRSTGNCPCPSRSSPPSGYQPLWPPICFSPPVCLLRQSPVLGQQRSPRRTALPPWPSPNLRCRRRSGLCPEASFKPHCWIWSRYSQCWNTDTSLWIGHLLCLFYSKLCTWVLLARTHT